MIVRTRHLALGLLVSAGLVHAAYSTTFARRPASEGDCATGTRGHAVAPATSVQQQLAAANQPDRTLPAAVSGTRDAILEAVQSGHLEDLQAALDLNELKPELADVPVPDPMAFWRAVSADGNGRDILAIIGVLLDLPHAMTPLGKDLENTSLYIWPAFADRPLAQLTLEETVQLEQLETAQKIAVMRVAGKYTGWRLVIGADGVWHSFRRYD